MRTIKNMFLNPPDLTPDQERRIGNLLLNAWSAEYALRILPVSDDESFIERSLHWLIPQAYYTSVFSLRAVLTSLGLETNSKDAIEGASLLCHYFKLYEGYNVNPQYLFRLKYIKKEIEVDVKWALKNDIKEQQTILIAEVEQINLAHEAFILKVLGEDKYDALFKKVPAYIQDSFLRDRFCTLIQSTYQLADSAA